MYALVLVVAIDIVYLLYYIILLYSIVFCVWYSQMSKEGAHTQEMDGRLELFHPQSILSL